MEEVAWGPVEWEIVLKEGDGEPWSNRSEGHLHPEGMKGHKPPHGGSWIRRQAQVPHGEFRVFAYCSSSAAHSFVCLALSLAVHQDSATLSYRKGQLDLTLHPSYLSSQADMACRGHTRPRALA